MAELLFLPTTRYRIDLFLEKVKQENVMFKCPHLANKHMRDCLNEIEDQHAPRGRMSLISLKHFNHVKDFKLHYHRTPAHFVLIHQNGAYAIFEKNRDSSQEKNLSFYRTQKPVFEFKSLKGQGLWGEFDEIIKQQAKMQL